jgi:hypothetical protein
LTSIINESCYAVFRVLVNPYELLPEMSESMIYAVMIRLMLKRLATSQSGCS